MHHPTRIRERLRQSLQLLAVTSFAIVVMFLLNILLGERATPAKVSPASGVIQPISSPPPPQAPRQDT